MRRARPWILAAGVLLFGIAGVAWRNVGALVRASMRPELAFEAQTPPPAPNYDDPASWSALPDRADAGDATPTGSPGVDQTTAPADVFYVHPTSYLGDNWNGPIDDATLNETTDRVATGIQATAFNGCCAVYAPRYRQASTTPFLEPSPDGEKALDLAYDDIRRAFLWFEDHRGPDRPFVLAAHSQGAVMAQRLLFEEIAGSPRRERLVAAYLVGDGLTEAGLAERAPDVPPCAAPDDTGCAVAWNARGPRFVPGEFEMPRQGRGALLCTNPLSWLRDGAYVGAENNLGAVFLETGDHDPRPGFADAQCIDGALIVTQLGEAPRDLMSSVLDWVIGPENYHPMEYQIFFMNLRENARLRVRAMLGG